MALTWLTVVPMHPWSTIWSILASGGSWQVATASACVRAYGFIYPATYSTNLKWLLPGWRWCLCTPGAPSGASWRRVAPGRWLPPALVWEPMVLSIQPHTVPISSGSYLVDSGADAPLEHHLEHLGVGWLLAGGDLQLVGLLLDVLYGHLHRRQHNLGDHKEE